jgi:ABC-2 type transport system permease protein
MSLATDLRTIRAVMSRDFRLTLTYRSWVINRLVGPIVWVAISVYAYIGIARPEDVQGGFAQFASDANFYGFLIVGQVIFQLFLAMTWWGGMAIERERMYGTLELIFAAPISRSAYVIGESLFGVLNSGWTVFFAAVVAGLLFTISFSIASIPVVVFVFLLTLASMLALGLFFAGLFVLSRSSGPLAMAIAAPMRFFSGTMFPVAALPTAVQAVSFALPLTYGLTAIRKALLSGGTLESVSTEVAALAVLTLICGALGLLMIRKMEEVAKMKGTLHQY